MLLEEKMNIYKVTSWGVERLTIERTTPTQAVAGKLRFNREVGDGKRFYPRGYTDTWNNSWAIETNELIAKYRRGNILDLIEKTNFKSLETVQLEKIYDILNNERIEN